MVYANFIVRDASRCDGFVVFPPLRVQAGFARIGDLAGPHERRAGGDADGTVTDADRQKPDCHQPCRCPRRRFRPATLAWRPVAGSQFRQDVQSASTNVKPAFTLAF